MGLHDDSELEDENGNIVLGIQRLSKDEKGKMLPRVDAAQAGGGEHVTAVAKAEDQDDDDEQIEL